MAVIVITQQIGSRGSEIAELAARELGYRFLSGQELVAQTSSRYKVTPEQLLVLDERTPHFWERLRTDTERFLAFLRAILLKEFANDRLIAVGRGIAHHLPESGCGLRVHVIGSFHDRVRRVALDEKLTVGSAEKRVRDYDHEIRSRVQQVCAIDLEDHNIYGAVLNSSASPIEVSAAMLVQAANAIDARVTPQDWCKLRDTAISAQVRAAIHAHPQLNHAQLDIECDQGALRINGPGLVPPWDRLTDQVVRQIEGVSSVEITADGVTMPILPE
ncbi:MAG: cytidylate kinase-like family protein [Candidatus Binataceae bacterium]|nr:cytidylate kinase-like family protein [Candidatus Binataceae bacterium]